jgi:predicted TIM-barrel fold metal-dependent hydrolase
MTNAPTPAHSTAGEDRLLVVDAQIHLWESGQPGEAHRQQPYDMDTALTDMDTAGVDASVVVPPPWDPRGNEIALRAAHLYPTRFAVMGYLVAHEGTNVALFNRLSAEPGMLGLRVAFSQPSTRPGLLDGRAAWLWPLAANANVPLAVFAPGLLNYVHDIARRYPDLKIIIDHIGLVTDTKDANAFDPVIAQLPELAVLPNVAIKLSSAPAYSSAPYPYENISDYLRAIVEMFGARRCFWGTDITRLSCSWAQAVTHFTEHLSWLSDADRSLIMGRALCEWLGWGQPATA